MLGGDAIDIAVAFLAPCLCGARTKQRRGYSRSHQGGEQSAMVHSSCPRYFDLRCCVRDQLRWHFTVCRRVGSSGGGRSAASASIFVMLLTIVVQHHRLFVNHSFEVYLAAP